MSLRGTLHTIKQNVPTPAWVRFPNQQRFCCCCSIRTGASLIGWFNFIVNSLYIGMVLLTMTEIRNAASDVKKHAEEYQWRNYEDERPAAGNQFVGSPQITPPDHINLAEAAPAVDTELENVRAGSGESDIIVLSDHRNLSAVTPIIDTEELEKLRAVIDFTLPLMYKSICIPAFIIIFSILWLITVESRKLLYVRLFGKAFIIAIFVQLIAQLGFLIYVEVRVQDFYHAHTNVVVWIIFAIYAILNMYFVPILGEFIKRRMRECAQGMEQGLLTSEMNPRARVAEEYIQDAFIVEPDTDMVQFEASLVTSYGSDHSNASQNKENSTESFGDDGPI